MKYPKALENLIKELASLPSVGPKTAERYAFYLLRQNEDSLNRFAKSLAELKGNILVCSQCLAISETNPCPICADLKRQREALCIVENIQDLIAIESTGQYQGLYFVLGGLISMIDKVGPESINIKRLENRINKGGIKEMILALNFNLEGETTAIYLNKLFKDNVRITHLAKGLSAGSDLEYADQVTLKNAFKYRNEIK
jgi:recombination protein RecR